MSWHFALLTLIIVNTCSVIFTKVAADKLAKEKAKGIFWQYLFCAVIAILYALFSGNTIFTPAIFWVGTVGLTNTFGNYFQWQASGLSLSRTALFFPLMEVITIALALIFLQETILWNIQLTVGVALCFLAMGLLRLPVKDEGGIKESPGRKWLASVLGMILIFGIAGFLTKLFSFTLSRESFLAAWYVGGWLGSFLIIGLTKQNPIQISGKALLIILPLSLAIIGALFALYWTYQLGGPVSFVLPIRGLAITIIPILIGWWFFKERKGLSKQEWFGFLAGISGAILILLR